MVNVKVLEILWEVEVLKKVLVAIEEVLKVPWVVVVVSEEAVDVLSVSKGCVEVLEFSEKVLHLFLDVLWSMTRF